MDPEALRRRSAPHADGASGSGNGSNVAPPLPPSLPARHPLNIAKRLAFISASIYGLHELKVYHAILHSPHVRHFWFKLGMASSVAILAIKGYVELYQGKAKKKKVEYQNFKTATHVTIALILLASVSFHVSLWPHYGAVKTVLIMLIFGFGVLIPAALLMPTWAQNLVTTVLMTFFIQDVALLAGSVPKPIVVAFAVKTNPVRSASMAILSEEEE